MSHINFSHNWNNKLGQKVFTTIRKNKNNKYEYYMKQKYNDFDVYLDGNKKGYVTLHSVQLMKFIDVPVGLLCSDTGMRCHEAIELFNKFGICSEDEVIILTFVDDSQFHGSGKHG